MRRTALAGALLGIALLGVLAVAKYRALTVSSHTVTHREPKPLPVLPTDTFVEFPPITESDPSSEATDDSTPKRMDISKLRAGVRSGDSIRVDEVGGDPAPGDAEELFMLISEIPGDVSNLERKLIIKRLMKLLRSIPGEESSRFLLLAVRKEGFIPQNEWIRAVHELSERRHAESLSYLELVAFSSVDFAKYPDAGTRAYEAAELVVKRDAEKYVPAIVQRIRVSSGWVFSGYLRALSHAPMSANPELGKLVPHLQERYRDLPAESHERFVILDVVADYAIASKSRELGQWVVAELTTAELTGEDELQKDMWKTNLEILQLRLERAGM